MDWCGLPGLLTGMSIFFIYIEQNTSVLSLEKIAVITVFTKRHFYWHRNSAVSN